MLQVVNLTPIFNQISESVTNTTDKSNSLHNVLRGTLEFKTT